MTQRERHLAIVVGMLIVVMGGGYAIMYIKEMFDERHGQITSLEDNIRRNNATIRRGEAAKKKRNELIKQSLPADIEVAKSLYKTWLIDEARKAEIDNLDITPGVTQTSKEVFYRHQFGVGGTGSFDRIVKFIHAVSRAGHLHRIESLILNPIPESRDLRLTMRLDALSLLDATDKKTLSTETSDRIQNADVQHYVERIAYRNFFGLANTAPKYVGETNPKGNPNKALTLALKATDDDRDNIHFEFVGTPPEGMTIDAKTSELRWTPKEKGNFEVKLLAMDDGLPPKSAAATLKISVTDPPPPPSAPPPPKPTYDVAKQAKISGVQFVDGKGEVWVNVQTEGKVLKLHEGDALQVGDFKATVKKIEGLSVEIVVDGGVQRVALGEPLVPPEG